MNTNSTSTQQQKQSNPAGPEAIRARQPAAPGQLKAERVQLQAARRVQGLKAERVQEQLQRMPGWRLSPFGRSLSRVREFPDAATAAAYAGFASQLVTQAGRLVSIAQTGTRVTVTVRGPARSTRRARLAEADLALARELG